MMKTEEIWPLVYPRLQQFLVQGWNIQLLSDKTGAAPGTVGGWLVNERPPVGLKLNVLWHLMKAVGIPSPEIDAMPAYNRYLGELVAVAELSMDDVCEILNVKNAQTAFETLRGTPPMSPKLSLLELQELYGELLEQKRGELPVIADKPAPFVAPAASRSERVEKVVPQPQANPAAPKAPPAGPSGWHDEMALRLAYLLGAALPLARYMTSDTVTAEQRSAFRTSVGQDNLFALLNEITALQNERARSNRR
jgi:hypothetical protein